MAGAGLSAAGRTVRGMRLLHTSDWHLGRTLHGVDLLGHQAAFLDHLVELVRAEAVDAVVVAGDVYDRAVPPVEAVQLLADALRRLSETTAVIVTPGNHDSAIRLGFGAELMRAGVHLRAKVADVGRPVLLADAHGPVAVHALPYLDPDAARRALAGDGGGDGAGGSADGADQAGESGDRGAAPSGPPEPLPRSHEAVMAAAMRRVRADLAARSPAAGGRVRSVVVAHAFVVGGMPSDSERDIRVGGVDAVPAGVFDGVDYVALGHLHGPQALSPALRYSGSPLAYSFSEMHHRKSTVLVELGPDGLARAEPVPAPVPRRLAEVTGTIADLLGPAGDGHEDDWLRAVVTDPVRPPELHARLKARFAHLLVTEHRPPAGAGRPGARVVAAGRDPVEVSAEFVEHVTGAAPTPAELAVLRAAYEDVLAAEASA